MHLLQWLEIACAAHLLSGKSIRVEVPTPVRIFDVELAAVAGAVDRFISVVFANAERPSDIVNYDLEVIRNIITERAANINQRLASA